MHLRLLILGDGELRSKLEALIYKLGIESDVLMPGFIKDPFAFMSRSKLFILSSAWEGLPGVLVQALACGCPVISTDCPGGSREILKEGKLGKLVPVNDVKALSGAIIEHFKEANNYNININELLPFYVEESVKEYLKVFQIK
jgi:glycosyltransferase involved in cell wall biosynthesis